MSLIPGCSIGVREKIQAMPSVGVRGEANVGRNKCVEWACNKKVVILHNENKILPKLELNLKADS